MLSLRVPVEREESVLPQLRGEYGFGGTAMSNKIVICTICGLPIYKDEPRIMSKPRKGRAIYAHENCIHRRSTNGKTKEGR